VYRATDTNLKRQVAIKVLPQTVAADAERLARFQREAEVLGALNHPNIAHIHGLEKWDGTIALVRSRGWITITTRRSRSGVSACGGGKSGQPRHVLLLFPSASRRWAGSTKRPMAGPYNRIRSRG